MNDGHNLLVGVYFVSFSYFREMEKRGEAIKMHSPSINFTFSSVYYGTQLIMSPRGPAKKKKTKKNRNEKGENTTMLSIIPFAPGI